MDMQERYWNMLVQLRFENFYLEKYLDHSRRWERRINMFLAITSAPVIAAWAIWKIWNITEVLWVGLVATSQVINAIRPFLPLSKRIKAISKMIPDLSMLCFEVERDWYFVAQGQLTSEEINQLMYSYLLKYENLDNPLDNVHLPVKDTIKEYADKETEKYCEKYCKKREWMMQKSEVKNGKDIRFRSRGSIPMTDATPPMPKVKPVKGEEPK